MRVDTNLEAYIVISIESTLNAIFTVDTPVMCLCLDFQSAGWSEGKTQPQELM